MFFRKASSPDALPVAKYLLMAMQDIVFNYIGENNYDKALAFMLHCVKQKANQYSYENCWLACDDSEIVAAVNVYKGDDLHRLREPVLNHLEEQFSRKIQPEDEAEPNEWYIDTIGVNPEFRGRGIASTLLKMLIREYVEKRSETLGLLVDKDNPKAKKLYLKLGFKVVGEKTLMGKKMEHLQIKDKSVMA